MGVHVAGPLGSCLRCGVGFYRVGVTGAILPDIIESGRLVRFTEGAGFSQVTAEEALQIATADLCQPAVSDGAIRPIHEDADRP